MSAKKQKGRPDAANAPQKKAKSYSREVIECIVVAVVLAYVIRTYLFEAFKIPTKSMEPTLVGDESFGDRIIAAKWAYRSFFGIKDDRPNRWEVVVFLFEDALTGSKKNYIKRCIGLPGETVAAYRGNIYIDREIERKPDRIQKDLWHPLYLDDLDNYGADGNHGETGEELPWKLADGWSLEEGTLRVRTKEPSEIVYRRRLLNLYVPYRPYGLVCRKDKGGCGHEFIRPLATAANRIRCPKCGRLAVNAAAELVLHSKREKSIYGLGQERPVGDLRVSFDVAFEREQGPGARVYVRIAKDDRVYTLGIPLGEGKATLSAQRPRISEPSPEKIGLSAGRRHSISFAHYDQRLVAWVDGREVVRRDYELRGGLWPEMRLADLNSSVAIGAESAEAAIDNIRLERDIYYLAQLGGGNGRTVEPMVHELRMGEYWMMGDNSPASRDSREWGPLRADKLLGKALFIWWPPDRVRWVR